MTDIFHKTPDENRHRPWTIPIPDDTYRKRYDEIDWSKTLEDNDDD